MWSVMHSGTEPIEAGSPKRETENRMTMTHTRDMISLEKPIVNAGIFQACGVACSSTRNGDIIGL